MARDALESVIDAEEKADARLAAAASEAKKILAEADAEGNQLILTATAEAEETVADLLAEAEQKAAEAARDIASRTFTECQALRRATHEKILQAAHLVVERIVND